MNIYIGNTNIASLYEDLRIGFESLGHSVFTMATHGHTIQGKADLDITARLREETASFDSRFPDASGQTRDQYLHDVHQRLLDQACMRAAGSDLCIFLWDSFLPEWQDLPLLRQQGVKTVVCFAGSEARVIPLENVFRSLTGAPPANSAYRDPEATLRHIRHAEVHADLLVGATQAGLRPMYLPLTTVLDHSGIPHAVSDRDAPVIVHAPSSRNTKGTEIWLSIFADLKAEGYEFTVRLLEGIPHNEFLGLLKHADIVCDGLIHGGKLAREGMAAGCAVLSCFGNDMQAYQQFFRNDDNALRELWNVEPGSLQDAWIEAQHLKKVWYYIPEENPCIPVSAHTAKDRLRELLQDKRRRRELALRGRVAIETYCSPVMVARDILQCVENPQSFETQAMLSFHRAILRHDFIPENEADTAMYNRTTDIVRNCPWYKRMYQPGARHGLVF